MDRTRRRILDHLLNGAVTGPNLADELSISRAAVWKHVEALRDEGFEIASTAAGYDVREIPEYGEAAVAAGLPGTYDVVFAESMSSTNERARDLATSGADETIVLANEQPGGRGRLGRTWVGPPGGIYLSLLLRPALSPTDVPVLTTVAGVAVAEAIEVLGFEPAIKWPNDVLLGGRKVAGILTEMEGEADRIHWVVLGVGINANVGENSLPERATSLETALGRPVDRRLLVHRVLEAIDRYREDPDQALQVARFRSATIGQYVRVETPAATVTGFANDIVHPGTLVLETGAGIEHVHAGDCEHLRGVDRTYTGERT